MKKNWGATGVTDFVHGKLEEHEQQQIRDELASRSIMLTSDEDFFNDLDLAIGRFLTTRQLADESKPSAVRKNLKGAIDAALELHKRLDELDSNSAQLIEEMNSGGGFRT